MKSRSHKNTVKFIQTYVVVPFLLLTIVSMVWFVNKGFHNNPFVEAEEPTTFSFTANGDISQSTSAGATLDGIANAGSAFHIALGDLSYERPPEEAWCNFVKTHVGETFPFQLLSGNHEDDGPHGDINNFVQCLPNRIPGIVGTYGKEYYFDYPQSNPIARFIFVSPNLHFPPSPTYDYKAGDSHYLWTANAIDSARSVGIPWVIVGMHIQCLNAALAPCKNPDLTNLLVNKKVDLVMTGHQHNYQRSKQIASNPATCTTVPPLSPNMSCVVDDGSDNLYEKDLGSVFTILGTGGVNVGDIVVADPQNSYFAKWFQSESEARHGFMKFTVTNDFLQADFVGTTDGTFADSYRIEKATQSTPTATTTAGPTNSPTPTTASTSTPLPTIVLNPTGDSFVNANQATTNFGTNGSLVVRGSVKKITYMKFDLASLAPRTIQSAKLRFRVVTTSPDTKYVKEVTGSWDELTITDQNKPALGTTLNTFGSVPDGTWEEIDLTSYIQAKKGQSISIGIESLTGTTDYKFKSRESVDKPMIVVQ